MTWYVYRESMEGGLRIGQCNDGVVYDVSGTLLASSAQRW